MTRHTVLGIALLAVAIPALGGEAHAAEFGSWYLGAGVGRSVFSSPPMTYFTFASIPAKGEIDTLDLGSSGGRIYGGFRVNRYFALEAGYADLGKITFAKKQRPGPGCPIAPGISCPAVLMGIENTTGEITAHGWNLGARVTIPLGERFEVSGKLGVLRSATTLRATQKTITPFLASPPANIEYTSHRLSSLTGVGMSYRLSPRLCLTLDWEQSKVGSADTTGEMSLKLLSGGVRLDF